MLVEAAIVLPVLFSLIFGILEIGSALKSYSGAANAVRAGGRMASVAGNDALADQTTMARIAREAAGIGGGEIEYIVIWHAAATGENPSVACRPAPVSSPNTGSVGVPDGGTDALNACNIYHRPSAAGGAFDMAQGDLGNPPDYYFGCTGPSDPDASHKVDCNWPARNRKTTIVPRGTPPPVGTTGKPDYIGIYIRAEHNYITGILGDTLTITDSGVNLIEPQGYSVTS